MTKKRLLVTGISGFLGWHVAHFKQKEWEIIGTYHKHLATFPNVKSTALDLSDEVQLQRILGALRPHAILHLAAASNPNFCEKHEAISYQVNVEASIFLAKIAKDMDIPFLFTSTDLVFDGQRSPYHEDDITNPVSIYAKHKIMAEDGIQKVNKSATIARLPLMYGLPQNGKGFMSDWLMKLKEGEAVYAFTDEYRTAVDAFSAVEGLFLLLNKKVSGLWHLGGRERMSRYDFAEKVAQRLGLYEDLVIPSLQEEVQMPANRPPDVSLDSGRAYDLGYQPRKTRDALDALIG